MWPFRVSCWRKPMFYDIRTHLYQNKKAASTPLPPSLLDAIFDCLIHRRCASIHVLFAGHAWLALKNTFHFIGPFGPWTALRKYICSMASFSAWGKFLRANKAKREEKIWKINNFLGRSQNICGDWHIFFILLLNCIQKKRELKKKIQRGDLLG
jgi:hypothetical protein